LTARDNFTGRNTTKFGVGEIIDLSFVTSPSASAASLGGLQWKLVSGGGTLTGGTDGLGTYTAPGIAATVVLRLEIASGRGAGIGQNITITVIPPSGAHLTKTSGIRHTTGYASVGFKGQPFLEPTDVSFSNILFGEGTVAGVGTGFYSYLNGKVHAPTATFVVIVGCNVTTGCHTSPGVVDTVDTGDCGPLGCSDGGPAHAFAAGDFKWPIPWQYQIGAGSKTQFTTATHHQTADAAGTATIEKAGAGPFSKMAGDPTSGY
jgi:hypothetical protein